MGDLNLSRDDALAERTKGTSVWPSAPGRRCLVMGILNATPDSFSDGGLHLETEHAIKHGLALAADGADIVDVGGESTRPNTGRTSEADERARVLPVVAALSAAGVKVSIDTMRASVAAAAIEAGAVIVNDVSGGLADSDMAYVVADADVPYVAMHWRAHSREMQEKAGYRDVVAEVVTELRLRVDALTGAGVSPEHIILDPGLGFAKTARHNWQLLRRLDALLALGQPVLIGASRKSFLGSLLAEGKTLRPPLLRDDATTAVSALAAAAGASCVRVHDVRSSLDAVRVTAAWNADA